MVRRIHLVLDDDKFERLRKMKGSKSWEEFLVSPLLSKAQPTTQPIAQSTTQPKAQTMTAPKSPPIPSAALPETVSAWINKAGAVPLKGFKAAKYQDQEFWRSHPDYELIRDRVVPIMLLEQARYELETAESMEKIEELETSLKTVCKLLIEAGEYYVDQEKKIHKVPE